MFVITKTRRVVLLIGAIAIVGIFAFFGWSIAPLRKPAPVLSSTKILDREGGLLYEVSAEQGLRTFVSLDRVAPSFLQALIASEDKRFYTHHGVDWMASARAFKDLVRHRRIVSGGSTLEQQLIKMRYFSGRPRSFLQKSREAVGALYWSSTHTKQETLTEYVNTVFFGNHANGIEAAAQGYFHTRAAELGLGQGAFLVGILPAPSEYDPYRARAKAQKQQKLVLDRMVESGYITHEDRRMALEVPVELFPQRHDIQDRKSVV